MLGWTEIKIYLGSLLLDRSLYKFFRQMLHFAAHFVSIRAYCQLCFQKTCLQLLRNVFIAAEPIPAGFSLFQFLVFLKHFSSCHLVAGTKLKVTLFNGFENTALNVLTQRGIFMSIFSIEQLLIFISVSWSAWKCLSFFLYTVICWTHIQICFCSLKEHTQLLHLSGALYKSWNSFMKLNPIVVSMHQRKSRLLFLLKWNYELQQSRGSIKS